MKTLIYISIVMGMLGLACGACQHHDDNDSQLTASEDSASKKLLQGIWVDDEGDNVQFWAEGDSLYYPGNESCPLYFKVVDHHLMVCGSDTVSYKIERLERDTFWYRSISDDLIKMHHSEYDLDSLEFTDVLREPIALYDGVVQKDSVVMYNAHRYRGYVYINPSKMRVSKTSYNENGMKVERVFYDNVIHICVYEGKKPLYAKDFTKKDFEGVVKQDFLKDAVLGDMDFYGVDAKGFWYEASLCIPDETSCYQVYLLISHDGELSLRMKR